MTQKCATYLRYFDFKFIQYLSYLLYNVCRNVWSKLKDRERKL